MSQNSFEEEVRRMLEDVPLRSRVDASAVLDRAKRARRRRRARITVLVVVLVAALALVIGVFGLGWWHRVAPAPVRTGTPNPLGTPTASPSTTPTGGSDAIVLPRVAVNRTSTTDPSHETLTVAQAAGVQKFADDVADGNVDSIVSHCWMIAESDLRDRWSERTNREQALQALSRPITLIASSGYTWGDPASADSIFYRPGDVFACQAPTGFTSAQALLDVGRLLDRRRGEPLVPEDAEAAYPLTCGNGGQACAALWAATEGHLSDDQTTRRGITDQQWGILDGLPQMKALSAEDPSLFGLPDGAGFALFRTPVNDQWVVFGLAVGPAEEDRWMALVAVFQAPDPRPSPTTLPRIAVGLERVDNPVQPLSQAQVVGVQRFADDLADGNLDSVASHCWFQAAEDIHFRWGDRVDRQSTLAMLAGPATPTQRGFRWADWSGGQAVPLDFASPDMASDYACPASLGSTIGQVTLNIQRLVDRHAGAPYHVGDTAASYPLSCADVPDACASVLTGFGADVPVQNLVVNGITADQWVVLADLAGKPLMPALDVGLPASADKLPSFTADPASGEAVVFADVDGVGPLLFAVLRF